MNKLGRKSKNDINEAFIIPIGSAYEKINGISHFFEHLLISKTFINFKKKVKVTGFTSEDYVIFFLKSLRCEKIFRIIKEIEFKKNEFEKEKEILLKEIKEKINRYEENFFREVWNYSKYIKSPLGDINDVEKITIHDMIEFKNQIIMMPFYFYKKYDKKVLIVNKLDNNRSIQNNLNFLKKRTVNFRSNSYIILYFNGKVEILYLIERLLKIKNPNMHIQISEKRDLTAFIIENKAIFPNHDEVKKLIPKVLKLIKAEIYNIKKNFKTRALNELESFYFYNRTWEERIRDMFYINEKDLSITINKFLVKIYERNH